MLQVVWLYVLMSDCCSGYLTSPVVMLGTLNDDHIPCMTTFAIAGSGTYEYGGVYK